MVKRIANCLGRPASAILEDEPFKDWPVEQSEEHDIDKPVISYVFPQHDLELACDLDDTIRTIFLTSDEFVRFNEHFLDLPFSASRQ